MTVRKDTVQIAVEIGGKKAGKTYADLKQQARDLNKELNGLVPGTKKFIRKTAELKKVNTRLAGIRSQTRGVSKSMDTLRTKSGGITATFKKFLPALSAAAIVAGIGSILRGMVGLAKESLKFFNIQARADGQLKARLISTNYQAGRSFEELKKQAQELQKLTLFGDEETQRGQALLLTFTKIRGEVFDRSIPLVQDYATALADAAGESVDLKSATIQVGKALNDPIRGISALGKAGVQFSDQQKAQIKNFVETGQVAKAQGLILNELETQFGGTAQAAAKAGLGGFTQLQNKLNDVKEGIGKLTVDGLQKMYPVLDKGVDFLQELVDAMISGEKANGRFATAVNNTITFLNYLILPVKLAYQTLSLLYTEVLQPIGSFLPKVFDVARDRIQRFLAGAQKLPILGTLIRGIISVFTIFRDIIENTSATFAGLRAAAAQAVENIKSFLSGLVLSAQIVAKELNLALSIKSSTKERLRQEIRDLKNLKKEATVSGRTIGQAYSDARDAIIQQAAKDRAKQEAEQAAIEATAAKKRAKLEAIEAAELREAQAKKASEARKKAFQAKLAELKSFHTKELLLIEGEHIRKELSDKAYKSRQLVANIQYYQKQLALLAKYGQEASAEALRIQNQLDKATKRRTRLGTLAALPSRSNEAQTKEEINKPKTEEEIQAQEELELARLQGKFERALLAEQDFELLLLEAKEAALQQRLDLLRDKGEEESIHFLNLQNELFAIQREQESKRVEHTQRTEELRQMARDRGFEGAKKVFDLGVQLLSADAKSRKKHGEVIKAFEIAKIAVSLRSEIQGIWRNANQNPINAVIPAWGNIWAGIQTGFAVGRAGLATRDVLKQKFAGGGFTGRGGPMDETGLPVAGVVHAGEWVSPPWMVESPIYGPEIQRLESVRKRGYAEGGLVRVDTTPRGEFLSDSSLSGQPGVSSNNELLERMVTAVEAMPLKIRAYLVYEDLKDQQEEDEYTEQNSGL